MASLNVVHIIGNLGDAPELKKTQTGRSVCTLSIATNRKWKDDAGKEQEEVQWNRVVVWGVQAENAARYLKKGSSVFVAGRLATRKYTAEDGIDRWVTEVVAQLVQFLDRAPKNRPPHPADSPAGDSEAPGDWGPPPDGGEDDIPF